MIYISAIKAILVGFATSIKAILVGFATSIKAILVGFATSIKAILVGFATSLILYAIPDLKSTRIFSSITNKSHLSLGGFFLFFSHPSP